MTTPVAGEYRDRATGLIVFGVFEILLGALCLLLALLMPLSLMMANRNAGAPRPLVGLIFGTGFYVLAGTALVWLGIGSLLARRWARALWVCLSGVGLGVGLMFGAWLILVPNGTPPKPWVAAQPTETAPAAPIPEASPAPTASLQDGLVQLRAAVAVRAAELSAASKAGEKTRAEWITAYRNAAQSELGSSRVEWNAAQAQYKRDALDAAADIEKAESED